MNKKKEALLIAPCVTCAMHNKHHSFPLICPRELTVCHAVNRQYVSMKTPEKFDEFRAALKDNRFPVAYVDDAFLTDMQERYDQFLRIGYNVKKIFY